jgi:hypothetical protein
MGARQAVSVRAAKRTKALRMILAGRLGNTPAMTMLLSANIKDVFIYPFRNCFLAAIFRMSLLHYEFRFVFAVPAGGAGPFDQCGQ